MDETGGLQRAALLLQEALAGHPPTCTSAEADEATRLQAVGRACPELKEHAPEALVRAALTLPLSPSGLRRVVWRKAVLERGNLLALLSHPARVPVHLVMLCRTLQGANWEVQGEAAELLAGHPDPYAQVVGRLLLALRSPDVKRGMGSVRDDADLDELLEGEAGPLLPTLLVHTTRHEADLCHLVLTLGPHGAAGWEVLEVLAGDLLDARIVRTSQVVDLALSGAAGVLARG